MNSLLTLLIIAFTSLTASAKWGPLPLRSLVEHSDSIVVAEFISEDSRKIEGLRTDQLVTLKVTTIIKGSPTEQISVAGYADRICTAQFIFPTTKGEKYLLFLQKNGNQYEVLNGNFGALTITDNKMIWFTDETQMQNLGQRKPTDLDTVIAAIKRAVLTSKPATITKSQGKD